MAGQVDPLLGRYGGKVLRPIRLGQDIVMPVGTLVSGETMLSWPLPNRRALVNQGKVELFNAPSPPDPARAAIHAPAGGPDGPGPGASHSPGPGPEGARQAAPGAVNRGKAPNTPGTAGNPARGARKGAGRGKGRGKASANPGPSGGPAGSRAEGEGRAAASGAGRFPAGRE